MEIFDSLVVNVIFLTGTMFLWASGDIKYRDKKYSFLWFLLRAAMIAAGMLLVVVYYRIQYGCEC